jgi:Putative prokaryotic signal transducing protein
MIIVATFMKIEDAYLARARLEGNGIAAHIRDEGVVGLDWFLSNAIGGVKVEVEEEDVQSAREILNEKERAHGILYCMHCGSGAVRMREMGVITGILCFFANLPLPIRCNKVDCRDCRKSSSVDECIKAGRKSELEGEEKLAAQSGATCL